MAGIAPETRMGAVHLTVSDLGRSLDYYGSVLALQVHARENGSARLGAGGEDLLVLYEEPGAQPAPRNTGLFHFALLVASRHDLARWLAHAANMKVRFEGMSDHLVSEAIYLRDPDWHGIEIYRDRPRAEWDRDGEFVRMATLPLDVQALLSTLDEDEPAFDGMPVDTTMGHVHLQVADIAATETFYTDLGFDLQARYSDQASFLSAGGYHHHVGANVWNSRGAAPPPPGSAALRHFTVLLPDDDELGRVSERIPGATPVPDGSGIAVKDPANNALILDVDQKN